MMLMLVYTASYFCQRDDTQAREQADDFVISSLSSKLAV